MPDTAIDPIPKQGKFRRALAAVGAWLQALDYTGFDYTLDRTERLERELAQLKEELAGKNRTPTGAHTCRRDPDANEETWLIITTTSVSRVSECDKDQWSWRVRFCSALHRGRQRIAKSFDAVRAAFPWGLPDTSQ